MSPATEGDGLYHRPLGGRLRKGEIPRGRDLAGLGGYPRWRTAPSASRPAGQRLELLGRRLPSDQAEALAEKMSKGTWTHDYPISASEAKELGLPVSTDMPNDVLQLMALYPQPVRMQAGGVEYLPVPRQKKPPRREP
jgi:serine dehydrogenase proteinase